MILAYRNFVSLTLCHDMHSNSKGNTANKGLVGLASVKKKKKLGFLGIWAFNNTFAQMLKVNS